MLLLSEHNMICSNLTRPPTIERVKKMRKITQYYDKVIKHEQEEDLIKFMMSMGENAKVSPEMEKKRNSSNFDLKSMSMEENFESNGKIEP